MNDQLAANGQMSWMALDDSSKQHVIRIVFATRPSTTAIRQLMAKVCPRCSRNGITNERPRDFCLSGYRVSATIMTNWDREQQYQVDDKDDATSFIA